MNFSKYAPLIFLAIVAYQIVMAILQGNAKRQQQERARGASRAPQRGNEGVAQGRPTAETLAERRRAQLEELRARRQGRGMQPGSPVQIRTAPVPPAQTVQPAPATIIPPLELGRKALHKQQQAEKALKEEKRLRREQQLRTSALRQEREQEAQRKQRDRSRLLAQQQQREQSRQVTVEASDTAPAGPVDPYAKRRAVGVGRRGLVARMHDRTSLRELFIFKELIDKPLALRQSDQS